MARQYPESQVQPYFGKPSFVDDQRMQNSDAEFSYVRNSFFTAGQDSFTSAPAQDPEMFEKLTNIQPVVSGTLKRRWGYTPFSNSLGRGTGFSRLFEFQRDSDGLRRIIGTTGTGTNLTLQALTEAGTIASVEDTAILGSPAPDAIAVRGLTSRNYFYIIDGSTAGADAVKWSGSALSLGTPDVTTFGIAGPVAPFTLQPLSVSSDTSSVGAGTSLWSSNLVGSFDNLVATVVNNSSANSAYLKCILFNPGYFNTSNTSLTVIGLQVNLYGVKITKNLDGSWPSIKTQFYKAGVLQTAASHSYVGGTTTGVFGQFGNGLLNVSLGGAADLWSNTWSASDITDPNFGVAIQATGLDNSLLGGTGSVQLDAVKVVIYYSQAPVISSTGAGNISLVSGRIYFTANQNTITGHTSDLSAASTSTGPLTSANVVLSPLPISTDSQVNQKLILATADGGDEQNLYLIGTTTNASTTFTDNMPEATLLVQPKYLSTDAFGSEFGIGQNLQPPAGNLIIKHRGRLYIAKGQLLYFSKNLAEVTTDTGTVTSRWEECWPGSNFLDISESAETTQALLSDGSVLYIGTERHIRRLLGDGPDNFQEPEILFNETGVLSQDVWKIAFLEGAPIGTVWLTPDFRILLSDFNSYQDIGGDVQDILNTINQSVAKTVCSAMFASNNAFDLYFLAIPTGVNTACDTVLVYNLRTKKWVVWNNFKGGVDVVNGMLYTITSAGLPLFLFSTNTTINQWSATNTTDRGINITSTVRTSWLDLGDSSSRKLLQEVETLSGDTAITLDVEGASLDSDFAAPRPVTIGASHIFSPFGPLKVPLATSVSKDRLYRLTWRSTGTTQDVLSGFRINALPVHRI